MYIIILLLLSSHLFFKIEFQFKVLEKLLDSAVWNAVTSIEGRFCVAESICNLVSYLPSKSRLATPLLNLMSQRCMCGKQADKIMVGCLLLVMAKNRLLVTRCVDGLLLPTTDEGLPDNDIDRLFSRAASTSVLSAQLLLLCLQEQNAFLQDVCCFGLSHLYESAIGFDSYIVSQRNQQISRAKDLAPVLSIAERVSLEVVSTLTREKRSKAPVGVAVAGESSATSIEGDVARMLERVLEGRAEEDIRSGNPNNNGTQEPRNEDRPVATNPEQIPNRDELLAAASAAAAQLGLTPAEVAEAARRATNSAARTPQDSLSTGSYGIYSIACKIAKKVTLAPHPQ